MKFILHISILLVIFIFSSCNEKTKILIEDLMVTLNPSGINPLSASIIFKTNKNVTSLYLVEDQRMSNGKNEEYSNEINLQILGLYPDHKNKVIIYLEDENGNKLNQEIIIETNPLPSLFPEITISNLDKNKIESGYLLCDFQVANHGKFSSYPFILDEEGNIRWFLDLSHFNNIAWSITKNKKGNLYFSNRRTIYEYDFMGNQISEWKIKEYGLVHHDLIELPNNNIVFPSSKKNKAIIYDSLVPTGLDYILELDVKTGLIVNEWDLAEVLDVERNNKKRVTDWIHINSVYYDKSDSTLLVSSKWHGVCKVNQKNELQWILADHLNWNNSGRIKKHGKLNDYLLLPKSFPKEKISSFEGNLIDSLTGFGWPQGQHAAFISNENTIILFDNNKVRNSTLYSRVVEYKIDSNNKTVEQLWSFDADKSTFSRIISNIEYQPVQKNMLINFGYCIKRPLKRHELLKAYSRVMEINYPTNEVFLDINLLFKNENGDGTFGWGKSDIIYRVKKIIL